jgi:hypothetical protein
VCVCVCARARVVCRVCACALCVPCVCACALCAVCERVLCVCRVRARVFDTTSICSGYICISKAKFRSRPVFATLRPGVLFNVNRRRFVCISPEQIHRPVAFVTVCRSSTPTPPIPEWWIIQHSRATPGANVDISRLVIYFNKWCPWN